MSLLTQIYYKLNFVPWEQPNSDATKRLYEILRQYSPGAETDSRNRAIDLGCGRGSHTVELAKNGWDVIGVEEVSTAVDAANRLIEKSNLPVEFVQGDVTALPRGLKGPFDLVIDIGCIHMLSKGAQNQMADEVNRITATGSNLVISAFSLPIWRFNRQINLARLEDLYPNWRVDSVERVGASDLPFLIRWLAPYFYRMTRVDAD